MDSTTLEVEIWEISVTPLPPLFELRSHNLPCGQPAPSNRGWKTTTIMLMLYIYMWHVIAAEI
jgi:hypothetical protein